jgi:molybdopterin synthase sulfur carrier subunit
MIVKFFAHLREVAGRDELAISPPASITADEFWDLLETRIPGIIDYKTTTRLALNHAYTVPGDTFREGDEIALIPPVSGG